MKRISTPRVVLDHPWYLYATTPEPNDVRYVFRDRVCHDLDEAVAYATATTAEANHALRAAEETHSREEST